MPDDTQIDLRETVAELRRQLDARTAARDEALAREAAIAEIMQLINRSHGDLAPVFDSILEKAHTLCGATRGALALFDGESLRVAAAHGYPEEFAEELRDGVIVSQVPAPLLAGARMLHYPDLRQIDDPTARAIAERGGVRTNLLLPLRKDGALLGLITCNRQEVRPFTDGQIALLENFAAQAVIAIENARLLTETREALEQQTATAEVLQVINSSPSELAPVFDAMLARALSLCDATHGHIWRVEGHQAHAVALRGDAQFIESMRRESPTDLLSGRPLTRIARGEHVVRIPDATKEELYRAHDAYREFIDASGIRSGVMVALRKDEALLGAIVVHRKEVRPFTDKQIALLRNFAAQAVIAMENARLLTETREALEQQTATAEVLQVINSSPGDLTPVFDAILEKAHALCGATYGTLLLRDGETFRALTTRGYPESLADQLRQGGQPGPSHPIWRLVDGESFTHVPDLAIVEEPWAQSVVQLGGVRTSLWVPLRRDENLLGAITAARADVRPFTEKQIALLQNFAAQAVIAMENARVLTETREALDQQTATAEVLGIINSSPGNLSPVFDALLEKALSLCRGQLWDHEHVRGRASGTSCGFHPRSRRLVLPVKARRGLRPVGLLAVQFIAV